MRNIDVLLELVISYKIKLYILSKCVSERVSGISCIYIQKLIQLCGRPIKNILSNRVYNQIKLECKINATFIFYFNRINNTTKMVLKHHVHH